MRSYISKFSVHGLVNIQVVSQRLGHTKYLNNKYGNFSVDSLDDVDIEIVISPAKLPENDVVAKKGAYHITDDGIFWKARRKLGAWQVCLKGMEEEKLRVFFWGNYISSKYLSMHILEPLVNIKLAAKGYVMLHGSAVQADGGTYVFCSKPGIGKTSLAMHLVEKAKANFLSDEFVILSREAEVYNFAMPVALYDYNIKKMKHLSSRFSLLETMALKVKKNIRQITNNRIKMPTYIDLNKFYPTCKLVTKDGLEKLYVINKTTDKELFSGQMDIDEAIKEIMEINSYQFRFFYDALDNYLSQKSGSRLDNIYNAQKDILREALQRRKFSKLFIPGRFFPDKKDIANLLA